MKKHNILKPFTGGRAFIVSFCQFVLGGCFINSSVKGCRHQSASRSHTSGWGYDTHTRPGRLKRLLHSMRFLQPLITNTDTLCDWVITCQTRSRAVTRRNYAVLLFFLLSLRSNNKETWRVTAQPGWSFGGRRYRLPWPTGYVSMETVASVIGRNLRLDLHYRSSFTTFKGTFKVTHICIYICLHLKQPAANLWRESGAEQWK